MEDVFEAQAQAFDKAASEFDLAAGHMRVAANHFGNREVPRAAAHASAARGHMLNAQHILDGWFVLHASKATLP